MEEYIGKHAKVDRKLYVITEYYDVDGGFGDAISNSRTVGYVMATQDEIDEYIKKWDKPRCYYVPYSELWEHHIEAEIVKISDLKELVPYDGNPDAPHCDSYLKKLKETGAEDKSPWDE